MDLKDYNAADFDRTLDFGSHFYVTHPMLCYGDSGGAGVIGEANVAFLKNEAVTQQRIHSRDVRELGEGASYDVPAAELVIEVGHFGSCTAWVRNDSPLFEHVLGLDDYCVLDDEEWSAVERRWENEALENWVLNDVARALAEINPAVAVWFCDLDDEESTVVCQTAILETGAYWAYEYCGAWIDVVPLAQHIADNR